MLCTCKTFLEVNSSTVKQFTKPNPKTESWFFKNKCQIRILISKPNTDFWNFKTESRILRFQNWINSLVNPSSKTTNKQIISSKHKLQKILFLYFLAHGNFLVQSLKARASWLPWLSALKVETSHKNWS